MVALALALGFINSLIFLRPRKKELQQESKATYKSGRPTIQSNPLPS